jgi:hypothetical protein
MEEVQAAADITVRGTVTRIAGRYVDRGADETGGHGLPMMLVEVAVTDANSARIRPGDTALVAYLYITGFGEGARVEVTPMLLGDEVVLGLDELDASTRRGAAAAGRVVFTPVGGDSGVVDVIEGELIPRGGDEGEEDSSQNRWGPVEALVREWSEA